MKAVITLGSKGKEIVFDSFQKQIIRKLTNSNMIKSGADHGIYLVAATQIESNVELRENLETIFNQKDVWEEIELIPNQKLLEKYKISSRNNEKGIAFEMSFMHKYPVILILRFGGAGEQLQLKMCFPDGIRDLVVEEYFSIYACSKLVIDFNKEQMYFMK